MANLKECRFVKMLFTKSGSGSIMPRLSLPNTWVKDMGLDQDSRDIAITFDGNKITIEKR